MFFCCSRPVCWQGVLAIPSSASKLHNIINVDLKHDDRFNDRPDDFCGRLSGDSVGSGTLSHDVFWESDISIV